MQVKEQSGGPLFERQGGFGFETCWNNWDTGRTVGFPHPLLEDLFILSTNWLIVCNSWQLSYHWGTALTANFAVIWMWTIAAGYITLLLFAKTEVKQCTCDVIFWIILVNIGWFRCFVKYLKSGAFAWIWENPLLVGSAATLVLNGNIWQTINMALSETVSEFSAIVWYWGKECT